MIEFKLKRKPTERADLSEWGWGWEDEDDVFLEDLQKLIIKQVERRLDIVFSEFGASMRLSIGISRKPSDLILECDFELTQFETYATTSVPIRELVLDAVKSDDAQDKYDIAMALRAIADEIAPN